MQVWTHHYHMKTEGPCHNTFWSRTKFGEQGSAGASAAASFKDANCFSKSWNGLIEFIMWIWKKKTYIFGEPMAKQLACMMTHYSIFSKTRSPKICVIKLKHTETISSQVWWPLIDGPNGFQRKTLHNLWYHVQCLFTITPTLQPYEATGVLDLLLQISLSKMFCLNLHQGFMAIGQLRATKLSRSHRFFHLLPFGWHPYPLARQACGWIPCCS